MTELEVLAQQLINGLMLGVIYGLIAVGFTLYFGVLNIINFAHGDMVVVGSFAALGLFSIMAALGLSMPPLLLFLVLLIGASIITVFIAVLTERLFIKPVSRSPQIMSLLVTLGLSIVLREMIRVLYPFGSDPHPFPILLPQSFFKVGEVVVRYDNIILLILAAMLMAILFLVINRTKIGYGIRAVAQDEEAAKMMGVDADRTIDVTFAIGAILATAAGIIGGIYNGQIFFATGFIAGLIGFAAAIIGGLGSVFGAMAGGLLFGLMETLASSLLPFGSEYRLAVAFLVVLIILVFRPQGILGEKPFERV